MIAPMTTDPDAATTWMNRRTQKRYNLDLQVLSKHHDEQDTIRPKLAPIQCSTVPVNDDSRASSAAHERSSAADFSPQSAANSVFSMSTVDSVISVPTSPVVGSKPKPNSLLKRAPSFLSRSLSRSGTTRPATRSASVSRPEQPFQPLQTRSRSRSQSNVRTKQSQDLERRPEMEPLPTQNVATPTRTKLTKRQPPPPTRTQSQNQQHPRRTSSKSQHPPRTTSQSQHPPRTSSSQTRPPPPTPVLAGPEHSYPTAPVRRPPTPSSLPPRPTTAKSTASADTATTTADNANMASITIGLDVVALMRVQIEANQAQIRANAARMAQLRCADERFSAAIQQRLQAVTGINEQLSSLRALYADL